MWRFGKLWKKKRHIVWFASPYRNKFVRAENNNMVNYLVIPSSPSVTHKYGGGGSPMTGGEKQLLCESVASSHLWTETSSGYASDALAEDDGTTSQISGEGNRERTADPYSGIGEGAQLYMRDKVTDSEEKSPNIHYISKFILI